MYIIDLLSTIILFSVVVVLFLKQRRINTSMVFVIISFGVLFFVALTNYLEALGYSYWDNFEDPLETLFLPLFIFAVLSYCLRFELVQNKKKEVLIRSGLNKLDVAMKAAQEGLWEWDSNRKELVIDESLSHLIQTPISLVFNKANFKEVVHENSKDHFLELLSKLDNNEIGDLKCDLFLKTVSNEYRWFLFHGKSEKSLINSNDIYSYGTVVDVSRFKEIESALIDAKLKAEKGEELKTAFLYNLSHEIRTPINGIIGFSEILQSEGVSSNQSDYINMITSSCQKLISVVDDIIEISKLTVGDLSLYQRQVNVNSVLERLKDNYSNEATLKGLEFKLSIVNKEEYYVLADESKLYRALENLVNNAVKFTSVGCIEIGYIIELQNLVFFVKDTGIGISKKDLGVVFGKFRQLEDSFKRRYGGAGLGLPISKGLIEVMGGEIKIESKPGKGTLVTFSLPLIKEKAAR